MPVSPTTGQWVPGWLQDYDPPPGEWDNAFGAKLDAGSDLSNQLVGDSTLGSLLDGKLGRTDSLNGNPFTPYHGTTPIDLPHFSVLRQYLPQSFGAKLDGSDTYAGVQAAINQAVSDGGGCVFLSAGMWPMSATPRITGTGVYLVGVSQQTIVLYTNPGIDWLAIGGQASQVGNVLVEDLYFLSGAQGYATGGTAFNLSKVANVLLNRVTADGCYNGLSNVDVNNVEIARGTMNNVRGNYGYRLYSDPNTSNRSDIAIIRETTIQMFLIGGDGIVWDGASNGLHTYGAYVLGARTGLSILNSAGSTTAFPSYGYFNRLETDRAAYESVRIQGGHFFDFDGCSLSNTSGSTSTGNDNITRTVNADANCVEILPDTAGSQTYGISFRGCVVGNCRQSPFNIQARGVDIRGNMIGDGSKAGVGQYDAVAFAANSDSCSLMLNKLDVFAARSRFLLSIAAGATNINAQGNQFQSSVTADTSNAGTNCKIINNELSNGSFA